LNGLQGGDEEKSHGRHDALRIEEKEEKEGGGEGEGRVYRGETSEDKEDTNTNPIQTSREIQ
jgi:hypothetical protein